MSKSKKQKYYDAVVKLGCIACRRLGLYGSPPQLHHPRHIPNGPGMGQKSSDYCVIPLCPRHHTDGPDSVHRLSAAAWARKYGMSEWEMVLATRQELFNRGLMK